VKTFRMDSRLEASRSPTPLPDRRASLNLELLAKKTTAQREHPPSRFKPFKIGCGGPQRTQNSSNSLLFRNHPSSCCLKPRLPESNWTSGAGGVDPVSFWFLGHIRLLCRPAWWRWRRHEPSFFGPFLCHKLTPYFGVHLDFFGGAVGGVFAGRGNASLVGRNTH
jgi:hypothetical protein